MNSDFLYADDGEFERLEQQRRDKIRGLIGSVKRAADNLRATSSAATAHGDAAPSALDTARSAGSRSATSSAPRASSRTSLAATAGRSRATEPEIRDVRAAVTAAGTEHSQGLRAAFNRMDLSDRAVSAGRNRDSKSAHVSRSDRSNLTDKVRGAVVGSRSERNYRSISDRDECKYDEMPPPPEYDEEEYEIIRESAREKPPVPYSDSRARGDADSNLHNKVKSNGYMRASSIRTGKDDAGNSSSSNKKSGTNTTNSTSSASTATPVAHSSTAESRDQRVSAAAARRAMLEAQSAERVRLRQRQRIEEQKAKEEAAVRAHFDMIEAHKRERLEALAAAEARRESAAEARSMQRRAEAFRRFQLLLRSGWRPWVRMMQLRRNTEGIADAFMRSRLLLRYWQSLHAYAHSRRLGAHRLEVKKTKLALAHYRHYLMRAVWSAWKYSRRLEKAKAAAVAHRSSRDSVLRRSMRAWRAALERKLRIRAQKYRSAVPIGDRCTLRHVFRLWQKYVEESREEREIEARATARWAKVRQWM